MELDSLLPPSLGFQVSGVCNPQGAVPYSLNCLPSSADSRVRKPVCTLQVITAVQCRHSLRDMVVHVAFYRRGNRGTEGASGMLESPLMQEDEHFLGV